MSRHIRRLLARLAAAGVLPVAALLPAFTAEAEERVSGTVLAVDPAAEVLVVEELTASSGPAPNAVQRRFTLAPNTTVTLAHRSPDAPGGWPHAYTATPLGVDQLRPGDFVTVTFVPDGDRLLARLVSVVRPQQEGSAAAR
ncbi:MAG: hypothetical protein K6T92_00975 [Candidatus Rokubacteria bacterium]|nr:hypothetical protein [Candidatus Rokubacteria bacterium]